MEITARRKPLKKAMSYGEIVMSAPLVKKVEKPLKPLKKNSDRNSSSRNLGSCRKIHERTEGSNTSSTESIKGSSYTLRGSLGSSKSLRKVARSEKGSQQSTPISNNSSLLYQPDSELGGRIQHIGDHLTSIEKKLNDFVELFKPLKILTEDPDEQLDSYRLGKYNIKAISRIQNIAKIRFIRKNQAAIKIQRAFRKYKNNKHLKALIKFKYNPLFKQPALKSAKRG